ncbi:MAG TPA: XdhC family protein [Rubrobacteraceae bacterium]|nr:XdhC family protein [Rubrobacteraceae bacterium]
MTRPGSGDALFDRTAELAREERPFAVVTVVRTEPPTSARPGNRAIVMPDGSVEGWLGGGCITPTARQEALQALESGEPRFVRISLDDAPASPGIRVVRMTCTSEGSADLYVEPFLPRPALLVAGDSPVAGILAGVAAPLGFRFQALGSGETPEVPNPADTWMVVATFGDYDEEAAEAGLRLGLPYVGLVASGRRAGSVLSGLRARGFAEADLETVRSPAGIPLGASGHAGVAISILAEVVSLRAARRPGLSRDQAGKSTPSGTAVDPICGMTVEVTSARYTTDQEGQTYYFCCAGCLDEFRSAPGKYAGRASA